MSEVENGPIYGVELLKTLPLFGDMQQAMPSRAELEDVRKVSERTAAAFEVLMSHYHRECKQNEILRALIRRALAGNWSVTELQEAIDE